jgi:ABC-type glycerol-3-phosphate transport system permease component
LVNLLACSFSLLSPSRLYPLVFLVLIAFKSPQNYAVDQFGLPTQITVDSVVSVFTRPDFVSGLTNSLLICTATTIFTALFGSMAGYSLAKLNLPFQTWFRFALVVLMIVPATILIVPVFTVVLDFNLQNNPAGLVLVYMGLQLPFASFMMASFFESLPEELLQAATIDGAGTVRAFWSIALPLSKQSILALSTLVFLSSWNDLIFSLVILQEDGTRTLQVALLMLNNPVVLTPKTVIMAGLLISALPNILIFALFNRQLTKGVTAGALK